MRRRDRATISELRATIDCLPARTRIAMLEGIGANDIIVGAYTGEEGVCPMLAAHRAGGRTNLISFAKAWDRFAFAGTHSHLARRATERELRILTTQLEASLREEEGPTPGLAQAVAEHQALLAQRGARGRSEPRPAEPPGNPDRSRELRSRPGWAWMRVVRRYDDYERALEHLRAQADAHPDTHARQPEPERVA